MSLKSLMSGRTSGAIGVFLTATAIVIVGVFFSFDFYLSSVSRELIGSWLQSEAVAIQEGHLLTSVTKHQRVLLSSQFVKGVALLDMSSGSPVRLIEFGSRIEGTVSAPHGRGEPVRLVNTGFFRKQAVHEITNRPGLLLVFDIESDFLQKFFFATIAGLFMLLIIMVGAVRAVEAREFAKRESYLKRALGEFIDQDQPSDLIESEFPFLVRWWRERKAESAQARRIATENERKILLGELAARVAHDIRSPLNTLNAVAASLKDLPENTERLLKDAIQGIRDIANGIVDQNRRSLAKNPAGFRSGGLVEGMAETVLVFPIVESVVSEKRIQLRESRFEVRLDIEPNVYRRFAKIDSLELKRTLSNLIDNGVEALGDAGEVRVRLRYEKEALEIVISDSGRGIPQEILAKIGEKGFSFAKPSGSGLGVHYAKTAVESWDGALEIVSTVNVGTDVRLRFPVSAAPSWFVDELRVSKGDTLIILDDDPTVHALWRDRLKDVENSLRIEHFFDPESMTSWFVQNGETLGKYHFLSDYDLRAEGTDGLDVIERLGVQRRDALLVTSAYEDASVRLRCRDLNVRVLPKPSLAFTPIVVS